MLASHYKYESRQRILSKSKKRKRILDWVFRLSFPFIRAWHRHRVVKYNEMLCTYIFHTSMQNTIGNNTVQEI